MPTVVLHRIIILIQYLVTTNEDYNPIKCIQLSTSNFQLKVHQKKHLFLHRTQKLL